MFAQHTYIHIHGESRDIACYGFLSLRFFLTIDYSIAHFFLQKIGFRKLTSLFKNRNGY